MSTQYPLARKDRLVIRELTDEVLIYDLARNQALCLNGAAGAVWKLSDGQTSLRRIAERISQQLGATIEEETVWAAVEQLGRDHLLEYCVAKPKGSAPITRREQLRSLGKAAAIAGPMVAALAIPKSAAAASCIEQGRLCTPGSTPCCKGVCRQPGEGHAAYRCTSNS